MSSPGKEDVWANELRRNWLLFPDDRLVALTRRRYPSIEPAGSATALDVGFGSGRHIRFLMDLGFKTSGCEIIPAATEGVGRLFGNDPLLANIVTSDIVNAPFQPASFDMVVAWGTVFLCSLAEMHAQLGTVTRLLKPGGSFVVNFRRPESWFSSVGEKQGDGTVLLNASAGDYADCTYTFLTTEAAAALLESLGLVIADQEEVDLYQGPRHERHSWSLFRAERPG